MLQSPSFWTSVSLTARMLALGATLPLVVARFDAPSVTLWYLFATIMSLQLIADMGLTPVIARSYSYAKGGAGSLGERTQNTGSACVSDANWQLIARIYSTTVPAYLFVAAAWLVGVVSFGAWAVADLNAASATPAVAWIACGVVAVGTSVRLYGNVYTSLLFGMNEMVAWRRLEAASWLASALAGVGTLLIGGDILALAFVTQAMLGVTVIVNRRLARRVLDRGGLAGRCKDRAVWNAIWPRAVRGGAGVAMHAGTVHAAGIVVARLESPAVAGGYLLAYNVMRAVDQFAQVPFYTKLPMLGACRVKNDMTNLLRLAKRGMASTYWVLCLGLIAVGLALPPFLVELGSSVQFVTADVWAVMATAAFVERYGANHIQLYMTTNHVTLHVANGITGIIFVLLCTLTYPRWGLIGIPASNLIANLSWFAWYSARQSYRSIDATFWAFERGTSAVPALLLLALATLQIVTTRV